MGRNFSRSQKDACWEMADVIPGRDPDRWRRDRFGNPVSRRLRGCEGCMCHEYDHIFPHSKGGETDVLNCQLLQTRVNRRKGDKTGVNDDVLKGFSCDTNFSERELDLVEMAIYGNVRRLGLNCRCKSIDEMRMAMEAMTGAKIKRE
mmetsp:Transcript_5311/g.15865  ORF Transcript_5311/g.15865 Transcript_5311/m.15865 type:complete len:147 (+) Transcript_5311:86-526(+)